MNKRSLLLVAICLYVVSAAAYGVWAHRKVSQWTRARAEQIEVSPKVHITPEGKKYHRWGHYRDRSKEVSLYEAKEQGFEHCKVCFRNPAYDRSVLIMAPLPWYQRHWIILVTVLALSGVAVLGVSHIPKREGVGYRAYLQHKVLPSALTFGKGTLALLFMTVWSIFLLGVFALFLAILGLIGMTIDWIGPATAWAIIGMVVLLLLWMRFFARRRWFN